MSAPEHVQSYRHANSVSNSLLRTAAMAMAWVVSLVSSVTASGLA